MASRPHQSTINHVGKFIRRGSFIHFPVVWTLLREGAVGKVRQPQACDALPADLESGVTRPGEGLRVQADTVASHRLRHGACVSPQDGKHGLGKPVIGRPFDPQLGRCKESRTQETMVLLCR